MYEKNRVKELSKEEMDKLQGGFCQPSLPQTHLVTKDPTLSLNPDIISTGLTRPVDAISSMVCGTT